MSANIFEDILGRERFGHFPVFLGSDVQDFGTFQRRVDELAAALRLVVNSNEVIALCVPPSSSYAVALVAAFRANVVLVPINPSASDVEKGYILENAGARALLTDLSPERTSFCEDACERQVGNLRLLSLTPAEPGEGRSGDRYLVFTSGSSTRPKAAILTDASMSSNVQAIADDLALSPADRSIVFTPPGYTYAMSQTLTHLWAGAPTIQYPHGVLFPAQIISLIEAHRLTGLACNPTLMRIFLDLDLKRRIDVSSVRYVKSAGQPLYSDLALRILGLFSQARMVCTYGCTENSPRICHRWLPPDPPAQETAWSVGWALPGTEVKVADPSGVPHPPGTSGEIFVRGASLMRGYWREEELNRQRLIDGWFRTGDLGVVATDGSLSVLGRADNIIGVGHEKVAPEEVEAVIAAVPGVVEVAVCGVPDALLDHVPIALIVTRDTERELLPRLRAACREKLAPAKRPRQFRLINEVPKTPYGKHDRKAIRAMVEHFHSNK